MSYYVLMLGPMAGCYLIFGLSNLTNVNYYLFEWRNQRDMEACVRHRDS